QAVVPTQNQLAQSPSITVSPNLKPSKCDASITVHFDGKTIPPGSYLWFSGSFFLKGVNSGTFQVINSKILLDGQTYNGPDAVVNVSTSATQASTTYSGGFFSSTYPSTFSPRKFMNGAIVYLPSGLSAHQKVTWSAHFTSPNPGMKIHWQWTAGAYSQFNTADQLGIKPVDGPNGSAYADSAQAGTPENYKQYWIPGARSSGNNNTAAWSGTVNVTPCLVCNLPGVKKT
ncbi:MAG TPA: hypothetical protein VFE36_09725, partial [Candidatus Baltobacteraceae bacterium]|nr:hypothetical protein [Candidatus Baltobacteraceae bacterium]